MPAAPTELAAAQAGDRAAVEALCRAWLPVVLQWARRLGGPRVDPDHATQEVFVVALRRLESVRGPEAFAPWLFAITRRVLAQHRRAVWGQRWHSGQPVEELAGGPSPEDQARRRSRAADIQAIVAALPEELAVVLVLYDIEERTMPEVQALLGVPEGTLRTRLRAARAAFRKLATKRGLAPEEGR